MGEFFNGGCFAAPYCQLKFKSSDGIISIVGAWALSRAEAGRRAACEVAV